MRLTDLQSKDIIDIATGSFVGRIVDIVLDDKGVLDSLVVEKRRFFFSLFSSKNEIIVKWNQIQKVGEDVIIINI